MRTYDVFHLSTECTFSCVAFGDTAIQQWGELVAAHGEAYVSESGSRYILIGDDVYRLADHWDVVGTCQWGIEAIEIEAPRVTNFLGQEIQLRSMGSYLNKTNTPAIGKASLKSFKLNRQKRI